MKLKTGKQYIKKRKQSWFFENINKTNTLRARLAKKNKEKTQTINFRNERGAITTDSIDIKRIIEKYY